VKGHSDMLEPFSICRGLIVHIAKLMRSIAPRALFLADAVEDLDAVTLYVEMFLMRSVRASVNGNAEAQCATCSACRPV